ncbi:MAG: hypothetical protein ACTHL8_07840 [Burkholderiaceae bacterium]
MNRSMTLALVLAALVAAELPLVACSKNDGPGSAADNAAASSPGAADSSTMPAAGTGVASTPMDSISSASAAAGSETASAATDAMAASAASR